MGQVLTRFAPAQAPPFPLFPDAWMCATRDTDPPAARRRAGPALRRPCGPVARLPLLGHICELPAN